ncbi:MAG: TolC family protein [Bacteroidetes bacterium]|nr:TolC family protein [Bacteroidota bacterium]
MKLSNCFLICLFNLFFVNLVSSQDQLTLEQAIDIGLKNNYDISIVKNNATIASNNNSLGNAGMLPKVDLQASTGVANNATKQEFSSGLTVDKSGVQSNNINAGVYLTWTLFDGFKMFASHKRLQELESMGMLSSKILIENTLSKIIVTYYDIVRQKQLIIGLSDNISISEERLKIAETKLNIGSGSKLDVLQAKVDKNAQTSNLFRQTTTLSDLKLNLNQLLARNSDVEFEVSEIIPVEFQLKYDELKNEVQKNNTDLLFAQRNIELSNQLLKETKSQLFPKLNFNANYLFARSENQAGFTLLNQNLGINLGLTASWNIFNGFNTNNQIKNAHLQIENADYEYKIAKLQVEQSLLSNFRKYQDDQKILALEEENAKLAKEAVDIALERFRIGSSNSLELKEIQRSYDEALTRLSVARYNAKVSETQLMKLNGKLIK